MQQTNRCNRVSRLNQQLWGINMSVRKPETIQVLSRVPLPHHESKEKIIFIYHLTGTQSVNIIFIP